MTATPETADYAADATQTQPATIDDLREALALLPLADPYTRAEHAKQLKAAAVAILSAVRAEAIYEATHHATYTEVAARLDVEESAVNKAVSAHRKATGAASRRGEHLRRPADLRNRPAYQYGQLLRACRDAADLAARHDRHALDIWTKRHRSAESSTAAWPALYQQVLRWLTAASNSPDATVQTRAAGIRARLDELVPAVAELPQSLAGARYGADVVLGYAAPRP